MRVNSTVTLNSLKIRALTQAQITALEQTAEYLHTEVVQSQVMPFDTGNLQNESTFADTSESGRGKVSIIHNTPYARRLYYHPEYRFNTSENPHAGGEWWRDWLPGGSKEQEAKKAYMRHYQRLTGV